MTTKKMAYLALLMALHIFLSFFYIQVSDNLRIYFTFFIVIIVAIAFPLKIALGYAVIEDLIAFFIYPTGPFFIGYTLTALLSMLIYALVLQKHVNIKNIIIAKTLVNLLINVALGSLWSAILYSRGFLYYFGVSFFKNVFLLPLEIILFIIFYRLLSPLLKKSGLITDKEKLSLKKKAS